MQNAEIARTEEYICYVLYLFVVEMEEEDANIPFLVFV